MRGRISSGTAGWKTLTLPTPVHIDANTNYVVAISNGSLTRIDYAEQPNGLDATITNGNLHAVAGGGVWTDATWYDADTCMAEHQLLPRRDLRR